MYEILEPSELLNISEIRYLRYLIYLDVTEYIWNKVPEVLDIFRNLRSFEILKISKNVWPVTLPPAYDYIIYSFHYLLNKKFKGDQEKSLNGKKFESQKKSKIFLSNFLSLDFLGSYGTRGTYYRKEKPLILKLIPNNE